MKKNTSYTAKRAALATSITLTQALDEAPLSLFHIRAFLTAGMGFFTDAYDLFIIGIAMTLIKDQWHLSASQVGLLGSATLLATLAGAFVFGRIADMLGRKAVYGLEAAIMALAAIASAFSPNFLWLLFFRFILGIGIGGDYPVSGVIMSEYSNLSNRGQLVSLVFSMQALGLVIGPVVALTLLSLGIHHDLAWRLMLGLGALPALSIIPLRRSLPESPRFVARIHGNLKKAATSIEKYSKGVIKVSRSKITEPLVSNNLRHFFRHKRNLLMLLGTAGAWFLLDYAYYGNTISSPLVFRSIAPHAALIQSVAWSLVIFTLAAVPGYLCSFLFIDRIGHKRLQWMGFIAMGICFAAIGLIPGILASAPLFIAIYGLSYFFTEFGPNVTTFVIPTEVFSVSGRATGHGIAAGIGKFGAFIGVFTFPLLTAQFGLNGTLLVSSGFALLGAMITHILPETSGKTLDEISPDYQVIDASITQLAVQTVSARYAVRNKKKRHAL